MEKLTDEELIQVYDLQEKYAEEVVDFVRHGEENDVYKFLNLIPELHNYDNFTRLEQEIYRKKEFVAEFPQEEIPQGKFVYKDIFENWKGTDSLREIFEEKYLWEFAEGKPEVLAIFAGNKEVAVENYSVERYEKLRNEIPKKLRAKILNLIMKYPKEIEEQAIRTAVFGHTNATNSSALFRYSNENMPEFERLQYITQNQSNDTIVGAYDLQVGLRIYQPELSGKSLTEMIRNFASDDEIFELVYGEKTAELLRKADEKVLKLASRYDFVNTEEKLPVLENHKICLFGTSEQKLKIPYKSDPFCVSDKDFEIILDELAKKFEREGFSKKYYPSKSGNKNYSKQSYKVIGRVKSENELQPQWNIVFDDGRIIKAKADEIISSAINERFYGEQVESFGKRPLEKVLVNDNEKMSLSEGEEKIYAILHQLKKNGESIEKIRSFLEFELKNLSNAR